MWVGCELSGCICCLPTQVDPLIPRNFGLANIREGKGECKAALQSRCQLQHTQEKAIVGIVTRLTTQKGIHLIKHAIHRALERGCQVRDPQTHPSLDLSLLISLVNQSFIIIVP